MIRISSAVALVVICASAVTARAQGSAASDREVLVELFRATGGPNWHRGHNWLTEAPLGSWRGVTTDSAGNVQSLNLSSNNLTGGIPPQLANLSRLQRLALDTNDLSGPIPPELGNLADLTYMALSNNDLSGPIPPELGNLADLTHMALSNNDLSGSIPATLGNISNLTSLTLQGNLLTGSIPAALGNMRSASPGSSAYRLHLNLSDNFLTGRIPAELGNLNTDLGSLDFQNNFLAGPVPESLTNLSERMRFNIGRTHACVPDREPFREWLRRIRGSRYGSFEGDLCPVAPVVVNPTLPSEFGSAASDRAALVAFYHATGGPNWVDNRGWLTDSPIGQWHGVRTNGRGRVTALILSGNNLNGSLPAELGDLTFLQELSIAQFARNAQFSHLAGKLTGRIPAELGNLSRLHRLAITGAHLEGPIPPELGACTFLEAVVLRQNLIDGPIPELGGLPHLREIDLTFNRLEGPIPPSLGNLPRLHRLLLRNNELTGPIPPALGNRHPELGELDLSDNFLTGSIPAELGSVQGISLDENFFIGPIPESLLESSNSSLSITRTNACIPMDRLLQLPRESQRSIGGNPCSPVPFPDIIKPVVLPTDLGSVASDRAALVALFNATDGRNWIRNDNWLTNRPLREWYGVTPNFRTGRVEQLQLRNNRLRGTIPPELGNLTRTYNLDLGVGIGFPPSSVIMYNILIGPLPPELGNMVKLRSLSVRWVALAGPIPAALGNLKLLAGMDLIGNGLTGPIPRELGNLTNLSGLDLSRNYLTGPIPPELGNLTNAVSLDLSHNDLTGTIPVEMGYMARLSRLDVGNNDLTGPIPPELGDVASWSALHFSLNAGLAGPLPETFADDFIQLDMTGTGLCVPATPAFLTHGLYGVWLRLFPCGRPEVARILPDRLLVVGDTLDVDLSEEFFDPDGDSLAYTANSSNPYVVSVGLSGSRATLTAVGAGRVVVEVAATDPGGLSLSRSFRVTVEDSNRAPEAVGTLPDVRLEPGSVLEVNVSRAFVDPDRGDVLAYVATSSAPGVVAERVLGGTLVLFATGFGRAAVEVTATDRFGLSAVQSFRASVPAPFTDDPIIAGSTVVKAQHFVELRDRIDSLRRSFALAPFPWTDSSLGAGAPIRAVHLNELRTAVTAVHALAAEPAPRFTDEVQAGTPLKAVHINELRRLIEAVE